MCKCLCRLNVSITEWWSQAGWDILLRYGAKPPRIRHSRYQRKHVLEDFGQGEPRWKLGPDAELQKGRSYAEAADKWVEKHSENTFVFLVQCVAERARCTRKGNARDHS